MRTCKKCGAVKPLSDFAICSKSGARRHECKLCQKRRVAKWYSVEDNRERRKARAREIYAANPLAHWTPERRKRANQLGKERMSRLRDIVYAKYGKKCACCGESDKRFLTIDHVHNDGKKHRKETWRSTSVGLYKWLIKNNFPKKDFQLLCFNCNLGKARNKGICPHKDGATTIS